MLMQRDRKVGRYFFQWVAVTLLICSASTHVYAEGGISMAVRTDVYSDNASPETKGLEVTFPIELVYNHQAFKLSVHAAQSNVIRDIGVDENVTLSAFTDVSLAASYTYAFPTRLLAGVVNLDVNIPTGKERLSQREQLAEVGNHGDIFMIDDFGEGLNVGLALGVERPLAKGGLLGAYGGYMYKGEFDPTSDFHRDNLDPGDEIFLVGLFDWKISPRVESATYIGYSHSLADTRNGVKAFQEGDLFAAGSDIHVAADPMDILLHLYGSFQGKDKELIGDSLQEEPKNSNGEEFVGSLELSYAYRPQLSFRMLGDIRLYSESWRQRAANRLPYEGWQFRYAFGPGLTYAVTPQISLEGMGTYFSIQRDRDIEIERNMKFRGVNVGLGVRYRF